MKGLALLLLLGITLPACDGPGALASAVPEVELRAEGSYRQGDLAKFILRNGTAQQIGYNGCLAMWERRTASGWQRIAPLRMCAMGYDVLKPGEVAELREPLTADWSPGEYRIVLPILDRDDTTREILSNPFTVQR